MATSTTSRPLRIGMFGGGVVGGGVYELIHRYGRLSKIANIEIAKICVRDATKPRSFEIVDPSLTKITTNPEDILSDDSLDCVVEVMGGVGLAKTVVTSALKLKKAVVTANKALLAQDLDELNALSVLTKAPLCYEAAVCGGIPIIHILQTYCYAGDSIQSISGICNGTTNYMLGKMEAGHDYAAALKEAQELGYAEADPTADVEGHDVRAKICLLAKLAFGTTVKQEQIPCSGISQITTADFRNAATMQSTIKLLGVAQLNRNEDSLSSLSVYVTPHVVSNAHLLAAAKGSGNAVLVDSLNMGLCSYTGPGAGRFPTANSVVADLSRLATTKFQQQQQQPVTAATAPFPLQTAFQVDMDYFYAGEWYVRLEANGSDSDHAAATEAAAQTSGVEIAQTNYSPGFGGFITLKPCKRSQVQAFCREISSNMFMPIVE